VAEIAAESHRRIGVVAAKKFTFAGLMIGRLIASW
jgi:hypothetical protein